MHDRHLLVPVLTWTCLLVMYLTSFSYVGPLV
jgi:hypothetical protein